MAKKIAILLQLLSWTVPLRAQSNAWLRPESSAVSFDFSFPSMGMIWHLSGTGRFRSLNEGHLKRYCLDTVAQYDQVFSDWSENSELRQLERSNLTIPHPASVLFLRGLKLADQAFHETGGLFDITVGERLWLGTPQAVGMDQLVWSDDGEKFRFKRNPRRLTFGGIAKGMAVGHLAQILVAAGISQFKINAGGGNLAEYPDPSRVSEDKSNDYVRFTANSFPLQMQHQHQHILHAKDRTMKPKAVTVVCGSPRNARDRWQEIGALNDAYSTALTLGDFKLPSGCRRSSASR